MRETQREETAIEALIGNKQINIVLSWVFTIFILFAAIGNLLFGNLLWAGFSLAVAVIAFVPTVAFRRLDVVLPWELLLVAALPIVGRTFGTGSVSDFATYLSVAAIALLIAVELHTFSSVRMTPGFAIGFVIIATMATAGVWSVTRWVADLYLGTGFITSEETLMWEFVASTSAGGVAGVVFQLYIRRRLRSNETRTRRGGLT
jgi:MFS family permease